MILNVVINIIAILIVIGLISYGVYKKVKFPQAQPESFKLSRRTEMIAGGILAACLVLVLSFRLGAVPMGLHVDEAGMAYDAVALAEHGTDRFGYHYPAYFINFGGGQNALYTHLAALVVRFFGFSVLAVRLPAVILALAAAATFYFLMRKAKGPLLALISLGLFIVLPFSIMHARWGLESYLFFPLAIMSIAALWLALKEHKIWQFVLAGAVLGLTLYTYAISYLILPAFLIIVLGYALWTKRLRWQELLALVVPLGLLAMPLIFMLVINQGFLGEITTGVFSIPKMWFYRGGEFSLSNISKNLDILVTIFSHDTLSYNANAAFGTMFYFSIPLVVLGGGLGARQAYDWLKKKPKNDQGSEMSLDMLMLVFFAVNFGCAMILDGPNINRINALYVPLIYFLAVAIYWLYRQWRWSLIILSILYMGWFGAFAKWYYWGYPEEAHDSNFFVNIDDYRRALEFAEAQGAGEIQVQTGSMIFQPYIYTVLAKEVDAEDFQQEAVIEDMQVLKVGRYSFSDRPIEEIDSNKAYVFMWPAPIPSAVIDERMLMEKFGGYTVYYAR